MKKVTQEVEAQMYAHEKYLNRLYTECFSLQAAQDSLHEHGTKAAIASMYKSNMLGTFIRRQDPKWFILNFKDHNYKKRRRTTYER